MRFYLPIFLSIFLLSCSNNPDPIHYGKDDCHWCQMRIMDPKFGAEALTEKGRCYKFDSAECLVNYLKNSTAKHSALLVTDYTKPEVFIAAENSFYLISKKMPSPMGGFLNAFENQETAKKYQSENGGSLYNWSELQQEIK